MRTLETMSGWIFWPLVALVFFGGCVVLATIGYYLIPDETALFIINFMMGLVWGWFVAQVTLAIRDPF